MLEGMLGGAVWVIANIAYGSMVRTGEQGFRRLAAFWLGWPGTFVSYMVIKPTRRMSEPQIDSRHQRQLESEEERDLLFEIRRDRARQISRGQREDEGSVEEEA